MHVEEIYKYFHIFLTILGTENMTRPVTYYRDCVWVHAGNIFLKQLQVCSIDITIVVFCYTCQIVVGFWKLLSK